MRSKIRTVKDGRIEGVDSISWAFELGVGIATSGRVLGEAVETAKETAPLDACAMLDAGVFENSTIREVDCEPDDVKGVRAALRDAREIPALAFNMPDGCP